MNAHALFVDGAWTRREVDDLVSPTKGYTFMLQAGGGIPGASARGFGRVVAQFQAWRPVGSANSVSIYRAPLTMLGAGMPRGVWIHRGKQRRCC